MGRFDSWLQRLSGADAGANADAGAQASAESQPAPSGLLPYEPIQPQGIPRSAWLWLGGLLVCVLLMLWMVARANDHRDDAAAEPLASELAANSPRSDVLRSSPEAPSWQGDGNAHEVVDPPAGLDSTTSGGSLPAIPPLPRQQSMPEPMAAWPPVPAAAMSAPMLAVSLPATPMPERDLDSRRGGVVIESGGAASGDLVGRYLQAMTATTGPTANQLEPAGNMGSDRAVVGGQAMPSAAQFVHQDPNSLLPAGTLIPCALEGAIDTQIDGPVTCLVTMPVRSLSGTRVLLDRGARLYGRYRSVDLRNARLAVEWTRLLTASGWSVQLAASSMDPHGNAGLPGERIDHWPRRIGSALIVSLLGDAFQWAAAKEGPRTSTQAGWGGVVEQPYQSQTAEALKELAGQATQASGEVRPTLRIRAGEPLLVALDRDLDFRDLLAR